LRQDYRIPADVMKLKQLWKNAKSIPKVTFQNIQFRQSFGMPKLPMSVPKNHGSQPD